MKIGGGSDLDTDHVRDMLTTATDSVCVHTVGFTLTLYRYVHLWLALPMYPTSAGCCPLLLCPMLYACDAHAA